MRCLNNRVKLGLALMVPVVALLNGCTTTPPPEAVLAGSWLMTPTNATVPALSQVLLTFDSNGKLTQAQYKVGDNALVTTPITTGDTTVNGTDVTIAINIPPSSTLSFEGTLNSTNTEATGNLTTVITVGSSTVTVNNGSATMTKQ